MATVFVTCFLFVRIYYKMDAECKETRRSLISRREKRWSMNSQRLEEIVAELMRPISDVRRTFDTDLSALLEEYLTEAGLHALDTDEDSERGESPPVLAPPNFAELALLLQQSASIYGRKVDFLYQHVLTISDSLQQSTHDESGAGEDGGSPAAAAGSAAGSKRRRKSSTHREFTTIELEECGGATREAEAPRPPPTLPRLYLELEPRVLADSEPPLTDYAGEPIGLLHDFQVTWRLHEGLLVEELDGACAASASQLRPVPLGELQAALEAAAPPPLEPPLLVPLLPLAEHDDDECEPAPEPEPDVAVVAGALPPAEPTHKLPRKRKCDVMEDLPARIDMSFRKEYLKKLLRRSEFGLPAPWLAPLVEQRKERIVRARLLHDCVPNDYKHFRGFEQTEIGGFLGWSSADITLAESVATSQSRSLVCATETELELRRRATESDDDGFFEQSSVGESDESRVDDVQATQALSERIDWAAWQASVVARAAAGEARGLDVRALGGAVLDALPADRAPAPFAAVLRGCAAGGEGASAVLLATLFLANAGNVEIRPGPPLSLDSFSLRLLSRDPRLYTAALDAELPAPLPAPLAASSPAPRAR